MAGGTRFVPNQLGIRQYFSSDPALARAVSAIADQIKERAQAIAPVRTGSYRDSIEVELARDDATGVLMARVNATDFKSHWIEFGTIDTPAFAPLRRALEGMGVVVTGGGAT